MENDNYRGLAGTLVDEVFTIEAEKTLLYLAQMRAEENLESLIDFGVLIHEDSDEYVGKTVEERIEIARETIESTGVLLESKGASVRKNNLKLEILEKHRRRILGLK